jgi:Xaa-Pro aminopeptidase
MRELAKPGVPEITIFSKTLEALIEAGSEQPITFFWDAGPEVNHAQRFPGRAILEKGDVIVTEISPRFCGYWAHFQAPVAVGGPTPMYKELFEVAYASYMNALGIFRPGIRIRDLAEAFEAPIKEAGMTSLHVYAHGTGGRGTEFPVIFPPSRRNIMPPESLADFERVMNIEIKKGMVLAFEPHVTKDMVHGLHLGDPVVVTDNGCRRLSSLDLREW